MFNSFHLWMDRILRVDAYELRGHEVVATGLPRRRFRLADVRAWQSFYIGGGVPSICIEFVDGRRTDYSDKHEYLFQILHDVAREKELHFVTA